MKVIDSREVFEIQKDDCLEIIVLATSLRKALECVFDSHFSEESEDDSISGRKLTDEECENLILSEGSELFEYITENIKPASVESVIIDYTEKDLY